MSFIKAFFFTLPLMVVLSIILTYLMYSQLLQPRVEEMILKVNTYTVQVQEISENVSEVNRKLDQLLLKP